MWKSVIRCAFVHVLSWQWSSCYCFRFRMTTNLVVHSSHEISRSHYHVRRRMFWSCHLRDLPYVCFRSIVSFSSGICDTKQYSNSLLLFRLANRPETTQISRFRNWIGEFESQVNAFLILRYNAIHSVLLPRWGLSIQVLAMTDVAVSFPLKGKLFPLNGLRTE